MNKMTMRIGNHARSPWSRAQWYRWSVRTVCIAGLSMSSLMAADFPVTTVNDSGVGSLRQGLSGAAAGDRMAFDPSLNGLTLTAGGPLSVGQPVTLLDANSMTLTDSQAFSLAKPLTVDWKGTLNLNGVLSDGATAGSLLKTGTGTLALSGANSYTGGTTLLGGTLRALNDSAIGTGPLTVNSQAGSSTLDLGNGVNLGNSISLKTGLIVNNDAGTTGQLSGLISESGGTFGINKTGTGT